MENNASAGNSDFVNFNGTGNSEIQVTFDFHPIGSLLIFQSYYIDENACFGYFYFRGIGTYITHIIYYNGSSFVTKEVVLHTDSQNTVKIYADTSVRQISPISISDFQRYVNNTNMIMNLVLIKI